MCKVYKFGGASVKDAAGVRNLESIVRAAGGDLMVVVSAMGKTTNALERVVEFLDAGKEEQALNQWIDIIDYHVAIMKELGLKPGSDIRLQGEIPFDPQLSLDENYDQVVSLGEIMSTQIVAVYLLKQGLSVEWWNMPKLLRTDDTWREARVDNATSAAAIRAGWERAGRPQIVVAQGFIGGTADGRRTTLGREGSDYTAALLGNYLDAESVTIWKDVPGILNADPRLEPDTILIPSLRYQDAVELSYSGAQVIPGRLRTNRYRSSSNLSATPRQRVRRLPQTASDPSTCRCIYGARTRFLSPCAPRISLLCSKRA